MKSRNWFWFCLYMLPFLLLVAALIGGAVAFDEIGDIPTYVSTIGDIFDVSVFSDVFSGVLDAIEWTCPDYVLAIVSYWCALTCVRILYEFVMFLPKFCISVFERRK